MSLYLTHLVLIKIFVAIMRPLPNLVYWISAVIVGILFIFGLSSAKYREMFHKTMYKIVAIVSSS